jgi:hypothetical protein
MKKQQTKRNRTTRATTTRTKSSGDCQTTTNTKKWLSARTTKPQTIFLTLHRGKDGYTIEEATILKRVNQHGAVPMEANVRAITEDLSRRGVTIR